MNEKIVTILGVSVFMCILGAFTLSYISKTPPEWSGDVVKVGLGILGGLVVGTSTSHPGTTSASVTTTQETNP